MNVRDQAPHDIRDSIRLRSQDDVRRRTPARRLSCDVHEGMPEVIIDAALPKDIEAPYGR